ncbi:GNAT family N-acetyltransferase [Allokutzneria albata]|uniref:Acetyltransferase (GNAT) family protein n=1 Tax=Allokutzneria albata TaxID=211114 RepID=A0A1G9UIS6_ALLAB|nr:GNAT family N-acetyltransferase [Allokutzneria albata]SDM59445.1 Acetyltransferase (GNAT) family protein [Allokutzneria albata]
MGGVQNGVRLRYMTEAEYESFRRRAVADYAAFNVEAGNWDAEGAPERAAAEQEKLLPHGIATPGHHLFTARDGDTVVGTLWIAERGEGTGRFAYIYEIHVAESLRGKGYGEAIMRAAEGEADALGVDTIKLNVHAHNAAARSLYTKLGYGEATILMTKRLT